MSVEWFKEAKIYQIFIDRFAGFDAKKDWKSPIFCGGNIKSITKNINYFKDLGVNTLWISPFYKGSAYHGYHTTDFMRVDSQFGTQKDLKTLIEKVHKNDMKIIADFVPNHCSSQHPFFLDAQQNKNSKYKEWFTFTSWPNEYKKFLSFKELPQINLENKEARQHIITSAKQWLQLGFDGFRLDHAVGPSHNFWKIFRKEIKQEFPHAVLIGEVWMQGISWKHMTAININNKFFNWLQSKINPAPETAMRQYIGELDGVLDFKAYYLFDKYIAQQYKPNKLKKKLQQHYKKYPTNYFLPSFLDNHDVDRFLFRCKKINRLKTAATIQIQQKQPAIIYYGTEIGMSQKASMKSKKEHGDVYAREPMKWDKQNKKILEFYKTLLQTKKITKKKKRI